MIDPVKAIFYAIAVVILLFAAIYQPEDLVGLVRVIV